MGWGDEAMYNALRSMDETKGVPYLTLPQRNDQRVRFQGGLAYDNLGHLLGETTNDSPAATEYLYVMDQHGNFYVGPESYLKNHSAFFAGEPVALAGKIKILHGRITFISNQSGHYHPPVEAVRNGLRSLESEGVALAPIAVEEWRSDGTHTVRHVAHMRPEQPIRAGKTKAKKRNSF